MNVNTPVLRPAFLWAASGALALLLGPGQALAQRVSAAKPMFSEAVAFDVSKAARDIAPMSGGGRFALPEGGILDIRPERGPTALDKGHSGDGALGKSNAAAKSAAKKGETFANFDGLSNLDNFNLFGFRVNPPDPVGDVGPNHYVEMVNLAYAVYDKAGNVVAGPFATGDLWKDFPIEDCTDPSGDPIVLYDQLVNRWILTQFTTRGAPFYYNCVAVSKTPDPTGEYYRYAFVTQADETGGAEGLYYFPDYPKYGVWTDSYLMTTRDFGDAGGYGISVYALEKAKMISGNPKARAVQFFLDSEVVPINLIGDGLLPADIDGHRRPQAQDPAPIFGSQDDDFPFYGATFDALNVWELSVLWNSKPEASLTLAAQLPVAAFDSVFPCAPTSRDCLPQPGIVNRSAVPGRPLLPPARDPPPRLPQFRRPRVDGHQPVGRGAAGNRRRALVRSAPRERRLQRVPAGHLLARQRQSLDGQCGHGPRRQHGHRLQRGRRRVRVPGHPLHGSPRRRSARPDDARGRHDRERHRSAADDQFALGGLHLPQRGPEGRLHVLVRERVLHGREPGSRARPAG